MSDLSWVRHGAGSYTLDHGVVRYRVERIGDRGALPWALSGAGLLGLRWFGTLKGAQAFVADRVKNSALQS